MRNNRALLIILALMITSCIFAIGFSTDTLKVTTQFWFGGVNVSSFFGYLNGTNQVTSSGIADGSIDEDKITTGAVQTQHIEDGTIAWADIGAAVKDRGSPSDQDVKIPGIAPGGQLAARYMD